jgi:hypothetical protein
MRLAKMGEKSPHKNISLRPLTLKQALRHAMTVPAPEHDPPAPKVKKKPAKKGKKKKLGLSNANNAES